MYLILYRTKKSIKGHIISSLLSDFAVDDLSSVEEDMDVLLADYTISQESIMTSRELLATSNILD